MAIPIEPFCKFLRYTGIVCPLRPFELRALWAVARYGTYDIAAREIGCSLATLNNALYTARKRMGVAESITAVAYAMERDWLMPVTTDDNFREART